MLSNTEQKKIVHPQEMIQSKLHTQDDIWIQNSPGRLSGSNEEPLASGKDGSQSIQVANQLSDFVDMNAKKGLKKIIT